MMKEISLLRKVVSARIPQSHYAIVSELMREGRVIQCDYEENDILIKVEIPAHLEYKVQPFLINTN
jgi:GTP-binding protein HflX